MRNVLTYASPPPADRVDVVWQGDELHITVPARPTPRAIAAMTMLVAAALFAWMTAIRESLVLLGGGGGSSSSGIPQLLDGILGRAGVYLRRVQLRVGPDAAAPVPHLDADLS